MITFTNVANNSVLAQEKVNHAAEEGTYHTQEGYYLALRKAIVKNVPLELIVKLEDPKLEFDEVEPRDILELLTSNANLATVLNAKELKELRDAPLVFNGDKNFLT